MDHFFNHIHGWFTFPELYKRVVNRAPQHHKSHFVEVGVWQGKSAAFMIVEIINSGKTIQFDCIDTWEGSEEHLDPNIPSYQPKLVEDPEWLYNTFKHNLSPVEGHYNAIRKASLDAVKDYEDKSLDFVFIDAAHDYENVKQDITHWIKKVKPGGTIAGHDYTWFIPVSSAVNDVLGVDNIKVHKGEGCWSYVCQ